MSDHPNDPVEGGSSPSLPPPPVSSDGPPAPLWPGHVPLRFDDAPPGPVHPDSPAPVGDWPPPSSWEPPSRGGDYSAGWQQPPTTRPPASRRNGIAGALAAMIAFLAKFGLLIFKLGKLGPTAISMVIAVGAYTLLFGWRFAVGLVLLILVHEIGHIAFSAAQGVPMGLPVFLGPFGAFTTLKRAPRDEGVEAVLALGGPVVGTLGAGVCFLVAAGGHGDVHLLYGLAYFGFFMNLFNLLPINPLDGGRVANALSVWFNVVGLVLIALLLLTFVGTGLTANPFLFVILIIGAVSTYQRFRSGRRGDGLPKASPAARVAIGLAYVGMLAFAAFGMTVAHATLLQAGIGPGSGAFTFS